MTDDTIRIRGARQNNLKGVDLDLPLGELIVVTGVSGSGKSSLAFDTVYAEGQRRYVETFSPYARQFLDRMDRPQVERIEGIPPAIAIDQTNPVRTSRSTVGTMTELADHLKLLYARAAGLFCNGCGRPVERDYPDSVFRQLVGRLSEDTRLMVTFRVRVPVGFSEAEMEGFLNAQGWGRIHRREGDELEVIQDRAKLSEENRDRLVEALEQAFRHGQGHLRVYPLNAEREPEEPLRFSTELHCPDCDIGYRQPIPNSFSFNSPMGACETCRGFGRVIGVDWSLVAPDESKSIADGAIKPFQSESAAECQADILRYARQKGVPTDVPWAELTEDQRQWAIEGEGKPNGRRWYGIRGYFDYLESKAYKMHIRVLLSKYRAYNPCPACHGARLKDEALAWRLGSVADASLLTGGGGAAPSSQPLFPGEDCAVPRESKEHDSEASVKPGAALSPRPLSPREDCAKPRESKEHDSKASVKPGASPSPQPLSPGGEGLYDVPRFRADGMTMADEVFSALPGLHIHELMLLPIDGLRRFFDQLQLPAPLDQATDLLLDEIRSRLGFLGAVGLGYLTLDRQSRTLSGGEVQRINLTTALGTSLVNTLFVLDEPSIGLHPRDMQRVVGVLHRLRDKGNSLLVVEHDPEVMLAADRIIDMGPGPGEAGGQVVAQGAPQALIADAASLTGAYLAGRRQVTIERDEHAGPPEGFLKILGACEHNLQDLDAAIPLQRLVCVTGVSGSGKSTLIRDVLFNALAKLKGRPDEPAGAHDAIEGHEAIDDVLLVDQSPIGRTSRANPASYVGALDGIRKLFAKEPLAKQRKYTAGTFSFNSGKGRCPTCGGSGFEHVEMQFLSDVYLRCPDCDGKRFRAPVLQVEHRGLSIAGVLELTVSEAASFFGDHRDIKRALEPLQAVGLGYLRLGQPVPTLSGGEAQRLKLAGHLAKRKRNQGPMLFLFDEPTTGLHFADIAVLLQAFERLLRAGHSVVVIEHNLDVMRASDWIIDLGPEGGDGGGRLVCEGTPEQVMGHPESHTGRSLREYVARLEGLASSREVLESEAPPPGPLPGGGGDFLAGVREVSAGFAVGHDLDASVKPGASPSPQPLSPGGEGLNRAIEIHHAREHNLKDISLSIPREKFTVITGVSGSGKSTVAFDILFNEGQRRYLESLNAYARQFVQPAARPDVDAIFGIPPTVAIEQRTSRGGRKSTVGTMTEIHHFLRLLFVKLGVQFCPECQIPIRPQSREAIVERILERWSGRRVGIFAPVVVGRKGIYKELAQWAGRKGFPLLRVDGEPVSTDHWPKLDRYREHHIELPVGDVPATPENEAELAGLVEQALEHGKGGLWLIELDAEGNWLDEQTAFSTQRACPGCGKSFEEPDPRLFSYNSKHGWCPSCYGAGLELKGFDAEQSGEEREWLEAEAGPCPACNGHRLRPEALAIRFEDRSIADYSALPVSEAEALFRDLRLTGRDAAIARDVLAELRNRLAFLREVGLGYLSLDRAAPTLSGGEAQRIRLAAQLGSNLRGVCYILDEPTIGLHPRDNQMLLDTLGKLEGKGNTLVVVEHDEETIRRAEYVLDLGPGAGREGGRVVASGTAAELMANPDSLTGRYLARPQRRLGETRHRSPEDAYWMGLFGARLNNLHGLDVEIPLERLVCVTGVSGSGKSTLVREVLHQSLKNQLGRGKQKKPVHGCRKIEGWEAIQRVLEVDQTPIGKTPRSCPATYVGFWDAIRKLFAGTAEARLRGYDPGRFSFNTKGGRCEVCAGQGYQRIEMSFLPDVEVLCDACNGARFNPETLDVTFKGRTIGEVLAMDVDEAVEFFSAHRAVHNALRLLQEVGLGYLTLGQRSPTLSGGEAQRIKLVTELAKVKPDDRANPRPALYILDEPTVGLHMADVERLIQVLQRLVDGGNSVIVIEHNLELIAEADWILDLGPEGGEAGGRIVAEGPPGVIMRTKESRTGEALKGFYRSDGE